MIKPLLLSFFNLVKRWIEKSNQRGVIRELSDKQLHDIGITRSDADWEARKRFWE